MSFVKSKDPRKRNQLMWQPKETSVDLQDGKHFPAVLEKGERVLNPKETKIYDASHPDARKTPMTANVYDKGGVISQSAEDAKAMRDNRQAAAEINASQDEAAPKSTVGVPKIGGTAFYGSRTGEKRLDSEGNEIDVTRPSANFGGSPKMPKINLYDEGGEEQGAPVDFPGMVIPNPNNIKVSADTDQDASQVERTSVPMDTSNSERTQIIPEIKAARDKADSHLDKGASDGSVMDLGVGELLHRSADKAEGRLASSQGGKPSPNVPMATIEQPLQSGATDPSFKASSVPLSNAGGVPKIVDAGDKAAGYPVGEAMPKESGLPVIGEERKAAMSKSGLPIIGGVPDPNISSLTSDTSSMPLYTGKGAKDVAAGQMIIPGKGRAGRELSYENYKADQGDLDKRIQTARMQLRDAASKGDQAAVNQAQYAVDNLQHLKETENRPGARSIIGKIGRGFEKAGNIAGDIVAPGTMELIPGTDMNKAEQRQGTLSRIQEDVKQGKELSEIDAEKNKNNTVGKTPEEQFMNDALHGGPNGGPKVDTTTGKPYDYLAAHSRWSESGDVKTPAGANAKASAEQVSEYSNQMPTLAPALSSAEREAYAFPKGYEPSVKEVMDNKAELSKANAAKLSGNRDANATAAAKAAANKRTMEERLVDQVAQDIAPMDINSLSALKTITSLRGDQRTLIYAKAKELNPNFNTAEVDRKVKMMDNYTNGKEGQQVQSFGTFLEHAGDANHVVQEIRSNLPPKALNTPLNALTKAGWGTDQIRISAALEPVRKEFEGFLLGGKALYAEDRKAAETILSDNSTPAQIQAALKQMANTVKARYGEMNNRFKNLMGVDIETGIGPLSDDAKNAAQTLGVNLDTKNQKTKEAPKGAIPSNAKHEIRDASGKVIGYN